MTLVDAPLTPEEEGMLDALDGLPLQVIDVVRVRLAPIARQSKTGTYIRAALDRLTADIRRDGFEDVEAQHGRAIQLQRTLARKREVHHADPE